MKRILAIIVGITIFSAGLWAIDVNIVMKDGTIMKGNMLGKTADELYFEGTNRKAEVLKLAGIKTVFDAGNGKPLDLTINTNVPQNMAQNQPATNVEPDPNLVLIPGSSVYYTYSNGELLYYYNGYWWQNADNIWYRSSFYGGPWFIIGYRYVPFDVYYYGPRWYLHYGPHRRFHRR